MPAQFCIVRSVSWKIACPNPSWVSLLGINYHRAGCMRCASGINLTDTAPFPRLFTGSRSGLSYWLGRRVNSTTRCQKVQHGRRACSFMNPLD